MSQRLAEEKKAAEETKRFYNEDLPDKDLAEEEAEFTDPDTSDHEFLQNEAEEEGEGESDACSDLDEEEGGRERETVRPHWEVGEGVGGEEGEKSEGEEVEEEEEEEGYSGGDESDGCFSDNENIHLTMTNRLSKKKQRLLDSDDEGEGRGGDGNSPPRKKVLDKVRKPSGGYEEASMGPLALFEDSQDNLPESAGDQQPHQATTATAESSEPSGDAILPAAVVEREGEGEVEEVGRGTEEKEQEDSKLSEVEDVVPPPAVPDSDKDNSLESSLLWGPSLPPAQPWNDNTATSSWEPQGAGGEGGVSQWTQRYQETQNTSLDEETQFLDANGLAVNIQFFTNFLSF